MSKSLNDRQERFIKACASGANTTQAARAAGYSETYSKAAGQKLAGNPEIKAAIDAIRTEGRQVAAYDLAQAMQESLEVIEFAKANKNAMAYFKAVEHRAKLSGLLIEQIHVKTEIIDIAQALRDARQRVTATIDAPVSQPLLAPVDVKAEEAAPTSARPAWSPFSE